MRLFVDSTVIGPNSPTAAPISPRMSVLRKRPFTGIVSEIGCPMVEPFSRLAVMVTSLGWVSRLRIARKEVKVPVRAEEGTSNFVPTSWRRSTALTMLIVIALVVPPPGAGLKTVTEAEPSVAISAAAIIAVNWLLLTKVVGRSESFQRTLDVLLNEVPLTVRENPDRLLWPTMG